MANSRRNFFSDLSVCSVKDIWNDLTGKTWNVGKLKRNAIKETNVGLLLLTIFEHCKISMAYWGEQVKLAHSGLAGQLPDGCPVPVPAPGANASARWNCLEVPCQCQVPGVVLGESGLASCLMVVLAKQPVAAFRGCWSHSLTCLDGTAAVALGQPTDNLCSSQTKPDRGTFLDISTFLTATLW